MTPPRIKRRPEDFVVDEIPLYEASGEGGHTFVRVEKRMRSTEEIVRELARSLEIDRREIGYAGRKDRVAVTRQWFSVPDCEPERACDLVLRDAVVLEARRHPHKLRTGHLAGNRFEIRVEGVDDEAFAAARAASEVIGRDGFANRFGDQRFGRAGDNAERGRDILLGKRRTRDRREARFLVSALQSEVFNRVLAERPLPLDAFEVGDIAMRHDSSGTFLVEDPEAEGERARRFEISPTGPIFGKKMKQPTGAPRERETSVLAALGFPPGEPIPAPRGIRLHGTRRSLRARPQVLELLREENAARIEFTLVSGSFATVLLEDLFGALDSGSGETADREGMLDA